MRALALCAYTLACSTVVSNPNLGGSIPSELGQLSQLVLLCVPSMSNENSTTQLRNAQGVVQLQLHWAASNHTGSALCVGEHVRAAFDLNELCHIFKTRVGQSDQWHDVHRDWSVENLVNAVRHLT
jgi:hypothetical protein